MIVVDDDPARLLDRLAAWTPVTVSKWLDRPTVTGAGRIRQACAVLAGTGKP